MKIPALTALLAGSALALAACGGASSGTTGGSTAGGSTTAGGAAASSSAGLHVASTSLGKVLVDQNGMTVYLLTADGRNQSTCGSDCLSFWPAAIPGHSKLAVPVSTTKTPAGTPTATVAGQPVYTFSQDNAPGDVNGEGLNEFGGTWYAVSPTGQAVTASGAASPGSTSPSTSGGSAPYGGGGY
jgi:predicted lipoprotein with Yx(FWY)xxD motif